MQYRPQKHQNTKMVENVDQCPQAYLHFTAENYTSAARRQKYISPVRKRCGNNVKIYHIGNALSLHSI